MVHGRPSDVAQATRRPAGGPPNPRTVVLPTPSRSLPPATTSRPGGSPAISLGTTDVALEACLSRMPGKRARPVLRGPDRPDSDLHLPVQEGARLRGRQGADADPQEEPSNARRPAAPAQPGAAGLVQLLPPRGLLANLQLRRSLRLLADRRLVEEATPRAEYAHPGPPLPPSLGDPRRRHRDVPATSGRHRALPLPGHQDPDPLVERSHTRITRTSGMNTWRAGCGGSRTSGSEGGPQKPTRRKPSRALRPDPYTEHPTGEGKLYLCAIKDVFSSRLVGWSFDSRMKARLVVAAIEMAVARPGDGAGCILHSDRGSQFRFRKVQRALARHRMVGSAGSARPATTRPWSRSSHCSSATCSIADAGTAATSCASRSSPGSNAPTTGAAAKPPSAV